MNDLQSSNEDDTLPDSAWKDSFDRLLDDRAALRDLNVIKRDVRASFNMNSSCENSGCIESSRQSPIRSFQVVKRVPSVNKGQLEIPKRTFLKTTGGDANNLQTISTPVRVRESVNPFKCTLSPIGVLEFQQAKEKAKKVSRSSKLRTTHVGNSFGIILTDCAEESKTASPEPSLVLLMENIKPKRSRKQVCFNPQLINATPTTIGNPTTGSKCTIQLQPGKWRQSLNIWRRTQSLAKGETQTCSRESIRRSRKSGYVCAKETKASLNALSASHRKSVLNRKYLSLTNDVEEKNFKVEILRRCGQNDIVPFEDTYNEDYLKQCCKIGEGAFGEVFLYRKPNGKKEDNIVLKIIPIEGKDLINGEPQKTFEQILQEVVICMELCALNDITRSTNFSPGFVTLTKVRCITGQYPALLQRQWEEYDDKKESENDHPKCFNSGQMFVVLEMAFSGEDLECFTFQNAQQSYYALLQIIYMLAVGEEVLQFEHRDLHWGNVLLLKTRMKNISYKIKDTTLTLPTKGVRVTIIDYTLSRITYDNGCYYNDLSCDPELFTATGDYQFEIYRMMRDILSNNWQKFDPKTNIFWISYLISKMLDGVSYSKCHQKVHMQYIGKLKDLKSSILNYKSCNECALDLRTRL